MHILAKFVLPTVFPTHLMATLFLQLPEQKPLGHLWLARMRVTSSLSVSSNSFGSIFKMNQEFDYFSFYLASLQ